MQFRRIHAVVGNGTADLLRQVLDLPPDEPLVSIDDCVACGPLTEFSTVDEWKALRADYWKSIPPTHDDETGDSFVPDPSVLAAGDSIVFWAAPTLAEQLGFVWFSQFLRVLGMSPERVEIVELPSSTVMIRSPKVIREHAAPETLGRDGLDELDRAWVAVTAPEPTLLTEFLERGSSRLQRLHGAMQAVPSRYPERRSGLSYWDRVLLTNARRYGPKVTQVLGHSIYHHHDIGHVDAMGPSWLWWRMQRLAGARFPLLRVSGERFDDPTTTVELTSHGSSVLEGESNALELNGIDEQIFGVHLDSNAGNVWVEDEGKIVRWRS